MAFCLNTLLTPGYEPGGTWTATSAPVGGTLYTPIGADGCIADLTLDNGQLVDINGPCMPVGTYQFKYEVTTECFLPVFVEIEVADSLSIVGPTEDLYVCRDGTETVSSDYTFQLADGSPITTLNINDYVGQCDGSPADYPVTVRVSNTQDYIYNNPSTLDGFSLNFVTIDGITNFGLGFSDFTQSCSNIEIFKTPGVNGSCGDEASLRIIVSPLFEDFSDTIESCEDIINIYDNMPSGLVNFIDSMTNGVAFPIGGTALFQLITEGYGGCTSTGNIQIQYSLDNSVFIDLDVNSTVDLNTYSTIYYKIIWIPEGTTGFDCGSISTLTVTSTSCCSADSSLSPYPSNNLSASINAVVMTNFYIKECGGIDTTYWSGGGYDNDQECIVINTSGCTDQEILAIPIIPGDISVSLSQVATNVTANLSSAGYNITVTYNSGTDLFDITGDLDNIEEIGVKFAPALNLDPNCVDYTTAFAIESKIFTTGCC